MARLCSFELCLHDAQRLPGWEDGLAILGQPHQHFSQLV
jgi:hypothetical protein